MGNIKLCKDCKYFVQHYIKFGRKFTETNYGHCIYPRMKNRKMMQVICEHFTQRK